jgi:hypothetical protein
MPLWIAFVCLVLSSCGGTMEPTVPLNQEFTLAPGESTAIDNTSISVRFMGVDGDSRCPADAVCIQGGDALVKIDVLTGNHVDAYVLHTGDLRPVTHNDLTIALVSLVPYPFTSRPVEPADYRATLRVSSAR